MFPQPWTLSTLCPALCLAGCPARRFSISFSRIIEPAEGEDPFLPTECSDRAVGFGGPILGAQCPSLSLPPRKESSVPSEHLLPPSPRPPPPLGPHQPRCPPSPLQPRRPTRALNLPRKLPEKTGRSSSPPSSSHSRGAAHGADSGEPTSAPKGDLFRIPEGPAPVPNREPIRTAVSAPGPAPLTQRSRDVITARRKQGCWGFARL